MFERRVRIVLVLLVLLVLGLLIRAGQVQLAQADDWQAVAVEAMRQVETTQTTRGRILDRHGQVLAEDVPCNDAAVAYWFVDGSYEEITAETEDVSSTRLYRDVARKIARQTTPNYLELPRSEQHRIVLSCLPAAKEQIEQMWDTLAQVGGVSRAEIDEIREQIVERVTLQRKRVIWGRYQRAMAEHEEAGISPWWRRWLLGEAEAPPEMEEFEEAIAPEMQAHVILSNLSTEAYNELGKRKDKLPGLQLIASRTRHYPFGSIGSHLIGYLTEVNKQDLADDKEIADELRAYMPRDLIGRTGLERLAEVKLRGTRGQIDHDLETGESKEVSDAQPGQDVRSTIDMRLEVDLRNAFENVTWTWPDEHDGQGRVDAPPSPAPGAAVVIDVKTGGVLALVSYPDYDLNTYAEEVARLATDDINRPLINRATRFSAVPGSTVKPIIGLAAVAEGLLAPHETIQCDGYLHIDGRTLTHTGRCWTASMYGHLPGVQGHQTYPDPHPSPNVNPFVPPVGHLTFADALQRSCNVFFETLGDKLGEEGLNEWMDKFGLGRPTGIGLSEQEGLLLRDMSQAERTDAQAVRRQTWFGAIGQGHVQATPLQMANMAATLARGGVWVQPTLLSSQVRSVLAEKVDLGLDPQALNMAARGMWAVINTPGGSGHGLDKTLPLPIAGKTGSAQAHALTVVQRDAEGNILLDEKGRPVREILRRSTRDNPNPLAPWYRRVNATRDENARQTHGWFIGYAPYDDPKIAFAVFVEYGGSGGDGAASVVTQLIDSCVRHGYLEATREPDPSADPGELRYIVEPTVAPGGTGVVGGQ